MRARIFANGLFVALSFALICMQDAVAQSAKDSPIAKWNLKCSSDELRLETTALVSVPRTRHFSSSSSNYSHYTSSSPSFFNSSGCVSKTANGQAEINVEQSNLETIPLDSITAIIKEDIAQRPVKQAIQQTASSLTTEKMVEMINQDPRSLMVLPLLPVVIGVTAGAMEPFHGVKTHKNSVRILWIEDGSPRSTNFYLSQGSATSLLNHLERLTGKTWMSVHFDNERQTGQVSEVLVNFTQPVSALNITVGPGNFRLLTFQGLDATRVVYLLSEDRKDILAAFSADASPLGEGSPWIIRLARAADGSWCFSELQTNLEQLKLHACQH